MHRRRLFWQVFPAYVLLTAGLLLLLLLEGSGKLRDFYLRRAADGLAASARLFAEAAKPELDHADGPALDALAKQYGKAAGLRITVVLPDGTVLAESDENPAVMENHRRRKEIAAALDSRTMQWDVRRSDTLQKDLLYVAVPVLHDEAPTAVVRTAMPATAVDEVLRAFERSMLYGTLAAVAAAVALSWLIARRVSRPLEVMTDGAARFGRGDLDYRLPVAGSREVAALSETMNTMVVELRQQIQEGIRQRNEQEAVLLSMQEGVLTLDNQGTVLNLNRAGGQMFQLDTAKVRGRPIHEVMRKAALLTFVEKALSGDLPMEEDIVVYGGERQQTFTVYGNALRNARDERIGVLIVLRDVTELRHLEHVRRDFVANASHELRTPVTSIKGFVETLLDRGLDDPESAVRFLQIILKQANRLAAIINDILSLARIEQESLEQRVVRTRAPILGALESAVQTCQQQAQAKSIALDVRCPPDLEAAFNAGLLEQAVINLIDNAVKYSAEGKRVEISAERSRDETLIRVSDQGCGIEAPHLPRLFERFYRTDASRSRELGGTGLGLAIAKHIAMAHNGSISVKSKVGEGSTFTIHLPDESSNDADDVA
jgi:two-component system phosphate regulon sensor histidine kinase PhoR